jgi:hypothetical protein
MGEIRTRATVANAIDPAWRIEVDALVDTRALAAEDMANHRLDHVKRMLLK